MGKESETYDAGENLGTIAGIRNQRNQRNNEPQGVQRPFPVGGASHHVGSGHS